MRGRSLSACLQFRLARTIVEHEILDEAARLNVGKDPLHLEIYRTTGGSGGLHSVEARGVQALLDEERRKNELLEAALDAQRRKDEELEADNGLHPL